MVVINSGLQVRHHGLMLFEGLHKYISLLLHLLKHTFDALIIFFYLRPNLLRNLLIKSFGVLLNFSYPFNNLFFENVNSLTNLLRRQFLFIDFVVDIAIVLVLIREKRPLLRRRIIALTLTRCWLLFGNLIIFNLLLIAEMTVFIWDDQLILACKLSVILIGGRIASYLIVVVLSIEDLLRAPLLYNFIKYPSAPYFLIIKTCLRHPYHSLSSQYPLTFMSFIYITSIQTLGLD